MPFITFSHPKGGVGKTTICFNYLSYLQKKKIPFTCIDLDGQSSISHLNSLRELNKIKPFNVLRFKDEKKLISYIEKADEREFVVIDSGGFDSLFNRLVLSISDLIITPLADSPLELLRLIDFDKNILSDIEKESKTKIKLHILLNKINSSTKQIGHIKEQLNSCKHCDFLESIIRDRVIYKNSLIEGKGVLELKLEKKAELKAKDELIHFFKELESLL
ncbi:ParA family protein [Campylobacter helveticus]|uniref:ParA family protein n=1 Tax=Campylobacter helveticus TaxID=28898 RepID=UPI002149E628|nr:ParA family protein [Campylobacter helveticus]MCR2066558.1 ParA family protein [Campylobacter helveticus]